jgi:hypothetical protein
VLSCVLELMLSERGIRLVLMSATADMRRYTEYFLKLSESGHRGEGDIKASNPKAWAMPLIFDDFMMFR